VRLDREQEAIAMLIDATDRAHAKLGSSHPSLAYLLVTLGEALMKAGRAAEAIEPLEAGLSLRLDSGVDPVLVVQAELRLLRALRAADDDPARFDAVVATTRERIASLGERGHDAQVELADLLGER
jgi:predicted Zn-dependent protease